MPLAISSINILQLTLELLLSFSVAQFYLHIVVTCIYVISINFQTATELITFNDDNFPTNCLKLINS